MAFASPLPFALALLRFAVPLGLLAACARPADVPVAAPGPAVVIDSVVVADSTLRFTAAFAYPQLRDAGPHTDAINQAIADSARAYVERFRPGAAPPPDCMTCQAEVEGEVEVARLDERLFSALISTYTYTGGAHGNADFLPLNVDLATGRRIALADLFAPGSAYLDTLSAEVEVSLARQAGTHGMTASDFWAEGYAPEAGNFARFTLGPDSLTVRFPPYQVGPYAAGPFAASIAYADLRAVLAPDDPAAALLDE